jgi:hypothetical protein
MAQVCGQHWKLRVEVSALAAPVQQSVNGMAVPQIVDPRSLASASMRDPPQRMSSLRNRW